MFTIAWSKKSLFSLVARGIIHLVGQTILFGMGLLEKRTLGLRGLFQIAVEGQDCDEKSNLER